MNNSQKNLKNYRAGKEPLKHALLQHPDGDSIYDYIKDEVHRGFWVIPFDRWQKSQKIQYNK